MNTTFKMADAFERRTRTNGETFYCMTDEAQDVLYWLYEACHDAHDGEWPNDWRWDICHSIACAIDEYVENDSFDLDISWEIADRLTDVRNGALARWLADDTSRSAYVDEVFAEYGNPTNYVDIWQQLRYGQMRAIEQMARILCAAYQANVIEGEDAS